MECKNCHWEIPAENINIQLAVAKCGNCHTVFSFYDDIVAPGRRNPEDGRPDGRPVDAPGEEARKAFPRTGRFTAVSLPRGMSLEDTGIELRVLRRWFSPQIVVLTFFTVIWDAFLLFWFIIALSGGLYGMAAAGSIHLLVGVGLTYYVIAGYLNSTIVAVNENYIVIHHAPLPWRGAKTIQAEDIDQVYCREGLNYSVHALLKDGQDIRLVHGLRNEVQALYIEQEAEKYLGIKDRPVPDELPRA